MKKFFLILLLMLVVGCANHFDFDEAHTNPYVEAQKVEYKEAFTENFGTYGTLYIDPVHNWGFKSEVITRGSNPNSNEWDTEIPSEITEDETTYVYEFFKKYSKDAVSLTINWSDFFVQHVWKGTDSYLNEDNFYTVGGEHMNWMWCEEDHVYNFNNAKGSIMLMQNSGTSDFSYHNSEDSKQHHEFKLLYIPNYGYYVGFDFCATGSNPNQRVERDTIYTDWIVKIVPGVYKNTQRIMAEDLGTTDDFDFNDVVFDIAYQDAEVISWYPYEVSYKTAVITLQAAGGTLPLYIEDKEVHELFGVNLKDMVNTQSGPSRPIVIYRIPVTSNNPNDIELKVINSTLTNKAITYTLDAPVGDVPYKICVDLIPWTKERQNIKELYPKFSQWIMNSEFKFWE